MSASNVHVLTEYGLQEYPVQYAYFTMENVGTEYFYCITTFVKKYLYFLLYLITVSLANTTEPAGIQSHIHKRFTQEYLQSMSIAECTYVLYKKRKFDNR